ncbi:MAG: glycosyltransferase family 39 protein [Gemmatimonadota bacterium]|nr:MAG: glycosyltransferase family 39 protein [Gemmatimonadota bacterium]
MKANIDEKKPWMNVHLLLFVFLSGVYLMNTTGYLTTSMCVSAYKTAESIIEDGDFALERPRLETGIGKDGKYYNYGGLAYLLVVTGFFAFFTFLGRPDWIPFTNSLVTPLACLILYLVGRELKYSKKTSILLALVYGIGTMAFVHSTYLMPEPLTTVVFLTAVLFLLKYKNTNRRKWLLLCACCTGLALIVRPDAPFFIFGMAIGVLVLLYRKYRDKKRELWPIVNEGLVFLIPLLLFFAIYAYYNYARFGSIFELGYTTKAETVLENSEEHSGHRVKSMSKTLLGFAGMWIIPCRSMFFINPILIFIFWAVKDFWRKFRFELILIAVIFCLYVFLYSNRGPIGFPGSSAWGVRYMVPMTGFMVIVMGTFVDKIIMKRNVLYKIFVTVFAISTVFQYIGVSNVYVDTQNYLDERYNTPENNWVGRKMMNMNPRWNLLTENFKKIQRGDVDLLYFNYFFRKETLPENFLQVKWLGIVPVFLICAIITSGYLLFKILRLPPTEPAKEKLKGKRKRGKKAV